MEPEAGNLAQMIDLLLRQIDRVRSELSQPEADPSTGLAVPKVSLDTVNELKRVVDGFRLFLWAYVDARAEHGDTSSRLQLIRMESAADMLGVLSNDFSSSGVPPTREAARLGEQVRNISPLMLGSRPVRGTEKQR